MEPSIPESHVSLLNMSDESNETNNKPAFLDVVKSVLAAMFGVQSSKNRKRDFTHGNPWAFIIVGIIMTSVFVAVIATVVKIAMFSAGY